MPSKRSKTQKKANNQHAGSKVPPTPVSASVEHDKSMDKSAGRPDAKSAPGSPYLTPPTSPSSPTLPPLSMDILAHELQKLDVEFTADDAITPVPEPDHTATNGSQEEQTDPAQQTQNDAQSVEHPTEQEQETRADEQQLNPELQAAHFSANEENAESDEQTSDENKTLLGGEQSDQDDQKDVEQVQIEPSQQPLDETEQQEQQASAETSKPDDQIQEDQTQTHSEDLLGEPAPDAQDNHLEDNTGQGESNDISAESQHSRESETQNGALPEDQGAVDSTQQSQEQEVQQLIDLSEPQRDVDQQQTSELDDQAQYEWYESSRPNEQTEDSLGANTVQESSNDLIQFDLERNDQQIEDDQDHTGEEHTAELHENGQDQIAWDDQAHEQELGEGDLDPGPGDGQQVVGESEQVAEQNPQLDQQWLIDADERAEDEQKHTDEDEQQADAELGPIAEGDQQCENGQKPVESDQQLDDELEQTPGADQLEQEQEPETIESEQQIEGKHKVIESGEQTGAGPEGAVEGDQQGEGSEEQEAIGSDHTLGEDPEYNKLGHEETDIIDQEDIQIVVQDYDDAFGDEEQHTAYEPELEDIQEEIGDDEIIEDPREGAVLDISAKDVASRDLLVVADLFANMKSTLATMSSAFERLGSQTEKMASIGLDAKAAEQLQRIKSNLEAQITRHRSEVEALKSTLHAKVKEALEARVRDHLHNIINGSVQNIIEEKVRQELSLQIPEDLCQQVISHKRQILEVKASLHNSEARRYNALQTFPTVNARLRPLLRPLPTPEQSPVPISRSSSMGHSTLTTPTTAFPQVPAPTPIRRTGSNSFRPTVPDTVPPSPSPFFPRDMTTLFALNPEETKRLLREYGLSSAVASPAVEHPVRPRGLSIVNEDAAEEEDPDVHARDLNKFMAHIGVPFLMIPAPKEKYNLSAPLSSRSRRKLLTPLIIK